MKKIAALVLAIAMLMAMSTTAFAATITTGNQTIDVEAQQENQQD